MKILLLHDNPPPGGGAEKQFLGLRDELRKRGHDARLFTSTAGKQASVSDYECFGTISGFRTLLQSSNLWAYRSLKKVLADFRPDVVQANNLSDSTFPFDPSTLAEHTGDLLRRLVSYDLSHRNKNASRFPHVFLSSRQNLFTNRLSSAARLDLPGIRAAGNIAEVQMLKSCSHVSHAPERANSAGDERPSRGSTFDGRLV